MSLHYRLNNEDNKTKRICFSKSIEGAISAIPQGDEVLQGLLNLTYEKPNLYAILNVYSVDETTLDSKDFWDTNYLIQQELVPDAVLTNEVWILTDCVKINHKVILAKSFDSVFKKITGTKTGMDVIENFDFEYLKKNNKKIQITKDFFKKLKNKYYIETGKKITKNNLRSVISAFAIEYSNFKFVI